MKLQVSSRDASTVPGLLADWLATLLPAGADPAVVLHSGIDANGMSSETLLFDATWTEDGQQRVARYVARVAPAEGDFPVFPSYDLQHQYDAMRVVGELTDVPVPAVSKMEPTGSVLGTPFFLMERIEGVVPQDVLPYTFGDNWLFDGTAEQQRRLQDTTTATLAALHAIPDAASTFAFLDPPYDGANLLERHLARARAWYEFAVPDIGRSETAERALAWLEANLPESSDTVLCWGDARIGNVMYDDFAPVAVLDWEMAAIGPRELDVSWMLFAHWVFQSITDMLEMPGMPDFMNEADVVAAYQEASGETLGDLGWYHVFNGLQWCVIFMRTTARSVHFGEMERPEDIETAMHHKPLMERIMKQVGA
ncbi:phosphotransferase family protein [Nocardioides sp. W7]|uniref:phosphotransferase family protein n=1 Tax=Nocardioides sp. W7 TaxID=2931390 RepID=UPI001FD1E24C|nr:phosphotransferase family protein [Nocardioides sp. W7]